MKGLKLRKKLVKTTNDAQSPGVAPQLFTQFCFGFDTSKSNYDHWAIIFFTDNDDLVMAC